jgi:ribonuclease R
VPLRKASKLIEGRLNVHRDGYAFLIPDKPVPGVEGDVYITKEEAYKAMHGDRVAIRLRRGDRGRISGEIMHVVKRAHP